MNIEHEIFVQASNETESGPEVLLSMNCLPRDPLANLIYVGCQPLPNTRNRQKLGFTIIPMLTSRLTLSMKTSLRIVSVELLPRYRMTHNSSRHRMGAPIAVRNVSRQSNERPWSRCLPSHMESSKQMVEKDFSPPDSPFVSRPLARWALPSGSTCHSSLA